MLLEELKLNDCRSFPLILVIWISIKTAKIPASGWKRWTVVVPGRREGWWQGEGKTKRGRPGNSNDVDRVARRETPVGVSSGGEEGWKREYDWFVRVAIHGGRRCRLESALFLDPERSISLVPAERHEQNRGKGVGDAGVEDSLRSSQSKRGEKEGQGRRQVEKGRRVNERDGGKEKIGWWTNRRSLTDVATPYVTFIADALTFLFLLAMAERSDTLFIRLYCGATISKTLRDILYKLLRTRHDDFLDASLSGITVTLSRTVYEFFYCSLF